MAPRATLSTTERELSVPTMSRELFELLIARERDLAVERLQAACADESNVGAGQQVQRLSVQARCEVRGGAE